MLEMTEMYDDEYDEKLVSAFYQAAMFLKDKVEEEGWVWSSNYLREHARCASHVRFTNTISPVILNILRDRYPELRGYIKG